MQTDASDDSGWKKMKDTKKRNLWGDSADAEATKPAGSEAVNNSKPKAFSFGKKATQAQDEEDTAQVTSAKPSTFSFGSQKKKFGDAAGGACGSGGGFSVDSKLPRLRILTPNLPQKPSRNRLPAPTRQRVNQHLQPLRRTALMFGRGGSTSTTARNTPPLIRTRRSPAPRRPQSAR